MADAGSYRIRWANVQCANGRTLTMRRMCIAERKTRWFGWWPTVDADWRFNERDAEFDVEHDRRLRAPIPMPRQVT